MNRKRTLLATCVVLCWSSSVFSEQGRAQLESLRSLLGLAAGTRWRNVREYR